MISRGTEFLKDFGQSLALHFLIVCGIFIGPFFAPETKVEDLKILDLSNTAIKVDVLELPKLTIKELEAVERPAGPGSTQAVVKEDQNTSLDEAKDEDDFLSFVKKAKKRKVKRAKRAKNKKKNSLNQKALEKIFLAGNKLQKGDAFASDDGSGELHESELKSYYLSVIAAVKEHWELPDYLQESGLNSRVQIFINADGRIIQMKKVSSSGNDEFDALAKKAIEAAVIPVPPNKKIARKVLDGHIVLGLPL